MGCTDGGCQRGSRAELPETGREWPSDSLRPREDVMEKRKLVCEEAGGVSQRKGLGRYGLRGLGPDPSSHVEGWRVLTAPPSTRLTAWVCLLQPWSQTPVCTPAGVPTHMHKYAQAPAPLSMDRRGHGLVPSYPESFLLASCLFLPSAGGCSQRTDTACPGWHCDLSSKRQVPSCLHNPLQRCFLLSPMRPPLRSGSG